MYITDMLVKPTPFVLFLIAAAVGGAVHAETLNNDSILHLQWAGGTCIFSGGTANFENTWEGKLYVAGEFGPGCPGTGGGPAMATLTVTPTTVSPGQHITITWSGAGNVCRNTESTGPAAVGGWAPDPLLCVGYHECGTVHTLAPQLWVSGSYTFALTCISGETAGQAELTAEKYVTVNVQ